MEKKLLEILRDGENRIIGREKYVVSAVLLGIVRREEREYIVLEKRALHIRQGGEISFPGGKFDKNDQNTKNTAIRETIEELGILKENIEVIGKFGTLVNPSGMLIDVYAGYLNIKSEDEIKYNVEEVEKVLMVPLDFFKENIPRVEKIGMENKPLFSVTELKLPERYASSWLGKSRDVYFYNYQGEVIWGITAEIIYEFIKRLDVEKWRDENDIK